MSLTGSHPTASQILDKRVAALARHQIELDLSIKLQPAFDVTRELGDMELHDALLAFRSRAVEQLAPQQEAYLVREIVNRMNLEGKP